MGRSCKTLGHLLCPREPGKARWRNGVRMRLSLRGTRRTAACAEAGRCCCQGALAVALLWRMAVEIHPFLSWPTAWASQQRASGWLGFPSASLREKNHGLRCNGRIPCPPGTFRLLTLYETSFPCHNIKTMEGPDLDPNRIWERVLAI